MFPTPCNSTEYQSLSPIKTPKINDLSIWPLLNHIPIRAFISLFIRFSPQIYKIYSFNTSFLYKYSLLFYILLFFNYLYIYDFVYLSNFRCIFPYLQSYILPAFFNILVTSSILYFCVNQCKF